ncbi:MAG: hypothetical protein AAF268_02805 [Cyanobacteria bacterium P01_A01_bin.3]
MKYLLAILASLSISSIPAYTTNATPESEQYFELDSLPSVVDENQKIDWQGLEQPAIESSQASGKSSQRDVRFFRIIKFVTDENNPGWLRVTFGAIGGLVVFFFLVRLFTKWKN